MRIAPGLLTLAFHLASIQAIAAPRAEDLLCNENRSVCVSVSVKNALLTNPVKLDVLVNCPDWVELEWEIRDDSGKRIDWNDTKGRMDWPTQNPPPQRTLHILDFILTTAESDRGTLTIWATRILPNSEQRFLPAIGIPVRLTRKTSVVTTSVPEDEGEFTREFNEWWFDSPGDPKSFHTDVNFEKHQIDVMHFAPEALIGITAAAVLAGDSGQSSWQVFAWHRAGSTAHVTIDGGGWAGAGDWLAEMEYRMERSMRLIPGIHNLKLDPPERLRRSSKAYN